VHLIAIELYWQANSWELFQFRGLGGFYRGLRSRLSLEGTLDPASSSGHVTVSMSSRDTSGEKMCGRSELLAVSSDAINPTSDAIFSLRKSIIRDLRYYCSR
jgi:hypothetical protein